MFAPLCSKQDEALHADTDGRVNEGPHLLDRVRVQRGLGEEDTVHLRTHHNGMTLRIENAGGDDAEQDTCKTIDKISSREALTPAPHVGSVYYRITGDKRTLQAHSTWL